jgi:hypothetical protein
MEREGYGLQIANFLELNKLHISSSRIHGVIQNSFDLLSLSTRYSLPLIKTAVFSSFLDTWNGSVDQC